MLNTFRQHRVQILLISLVFVLFLFNVTGMMGLTFDVNSSIALHTSLINQILAKGIFPALITSMDFGVYVAIGLSLAVFLPVLSPIQASLLVLVAMLLVFFLTFSYPTFGNLIPMEHTLLTILMLFVVNVLAKYFSETHARQKLISVFGQYVPPEVVRTISQHPENFSLESEARELTVFFADIKGFTVLSEQLDPPQLGRLLNTYFTAMTNVLHKHGATIDKYIGDAIMAFWGAPIPQQDHARRAILSAMDMQGELVKLRKTFKARGWPEIKSGIGINTGVMNVGNMGSHFRISYTVVGDAVNLGSRLESLTRIYGSNIIVSESSRNACEDILFRELDVVKVRGKDASTRIYEPVARIEDAGDVLRQQVDTHNQALLAYYNREWDVAEKQFRALKDIRSKPAYYNMLLGRIEHYRKNPPPLNWDGMTSFNRHDD